MAKSILTRLDELEAKQKGEGEIYMVLLKDGIYHFQVQGWDMTEAEYQAWEKTTSDNDHVFLITRREEGDK